MAPLACDPTALDRAGAAIVDAGVSLGTVISALTAALGGSAGMAGDDPVGAAFGRAYDGAATKLVKAMADTRNGVVSIGDGVRMSAHNYAHGDAMSDVTGRAAGLPIPPVTGPFTAGSVPSAAGAGTGAPAGWGWVAPYIGMIWPTGDSAKLRAAAAAWTTAWANFVAAETAAGGGTMAAIAGQQIPEGAAINKALSDASNATTDLARQCQTIAAQLNSYAAKVDKVHAAILDLLSRICDPLTGIKEVWDLLTDEDEDEIARIANDIKTVVNNFGQEAQILGDQIKATMSAAATAARDMGHWVGKEWQHFIHGTEVGRALNQAAQTVKGVGIEGWDFLEQVAKFNPTRLQTDPVGFAKDTFDMVSGELPLVGLGPDGGPGVAESWKALGKDVTHWDEWGSNPAEALGKTIFDGATLALPGGPLSKLGKAGSRAGEVLRGLKKPPEIPRVPSAEHPPEPPPAASKPPDTGRPAPSGKPVPAPADTPPPDSPTESKPPSTDKPPAGEPPKPSGTPPEPGGKPAGPAHPGDGSLPHPKPPEPVPAHAPVSPGGDSAGPVPPSGLPPEPSPTAPTTPHLPTPPSVPMGGRPPAEGLPGIGEGPHAGEPGVYPPEPPRPHEGIPHTPSDGGPLHQPGDGPVPGDVNHQPAESPHHPTTDGQVLQGERHTISGHGGYDPNDGYFVVPKGSSITTYAEHGSTITDELGNLIETGGDTSAVYSHTFQPGESIPNYTIYPPDGLKILGSPQTVTSPTLISELIAEDMGPVDLAVCTYDALSPTGKVYYLNGIYDELNDKFTPYER